MNPKQDSEKLMNAILPMAEKMLRQYGEFYPFGGYMKPDGTIVDVGAAGPDTDHPKSKDLLYVLRSSAKKWHLQYKPVQGCRGSCRCSCGLAKVQS